MAVIDLNSDLGEQSNTDLDERIMPYISSCNIACGGHAGDETSLRESIQLAIKNQVAIGAHPSFPDKPNFGRVVMDIELNELESSLRSQILLTKKLTEEAGEKLHHVKPHGALYNLAAIDKDVSSMIISLMQEIASGVKLYCLSHSITAALAKKAGIPYVGEAFADRRYESDRTLRSRKLENAVIHEETEVIKQVEEIAINGRVDSGGKFLPIDAKTICLHSDTKGAVNLAKSIHDHLVSKGAIITAV